MVFNVIASGLGIATQGLTEREVRDLFQSRVQYLESLGLEKIILQGNICLLEGARKEMPTVLAQVVGQFKGKIFDIFLHAVDKGSTMDQVDENVAFILRYYDLPHAIYEGSTLTFLVKNNCFRTKKVLDEEYDIKYETKENVVSK